MPEIFANHRTILLPDLAAQRGQNLVINLILAKVTQCLNEGATLASGSCHVTRGGVLKKDFLIADPDFSRGTIGEEDDFGWDLIGQTKHVRGVGPGRLQTDGIARDQSPGDGVCRWSNGAKHRMMNWIIVEAASQLADNPRTLESFQAGGDRITAAKVEEVRGREHPTRPFGLDTGLHLGIH